MKNPIEAFLRTHVQIGRRAMADPEDEQRKRIVAIEKCWVDLADRYGENGLLRIHDRARALVRELFGGETPPPLANAKIDPYYVIEADVCAEKLAGEFRAAGLRPLDDPDWKAAMNERVANLFARAIDRRQSRVVQNLSHRAAAPSPPPNLEAVVTAAVDRALQLKASVIETHVGDVRDAIKAEVAAFHRTMHRGVWHATVQYEQGQLVTCNGSVFSCQRDCAGEENRPAHSDAWLLVVKRGQDGRNR